MNKSGKKRLRNTRPKAFPGEALVGAGIQAAATTIGSILQANAAKEAAKRQADATRQLSAANTEALQKQNEVSIENQEKQIAFTRAQNDRNRDLQKQIQMNLQMLTGQQNEYDRLEATKIQVKNGGSARRRLRNAYEDGGLQTMNSSYGGANIPFKVTDGGGVIPLATTPEGYDLYEIVGNDHEHYHKTQGGKNKTGVGIKFFTGNDNRNPYKIGGISDSVVEGEGNQNTGQGELMLVTPNDAKFISKHTIKGFNPTQAVLGGMHPLAAFNQQEAIKNMYGISDSGMNTSTTPVKEMKRRIRPFGGNNYPNIIPDLSLDYLAPTASAVIISKENNTRSLKKCGGRKKAAYGWDFYRGYPLSHRDFYNSLNTRISNNTQSIPELSNTNTNKFTGFDDVSNANIWGGAITGLGNIAGAVITSLGNRSANRFLTQAYSDAGKTLADAYRNLKTVDMNLLDNDMFRSAHAMAAVNTPYVNTNPELTLIDRSLQRRLSAINRNSLSGAANLNRSSRAETDAYDMRSRVFADAEKQRQAIRQHNADLITQVANENANRNVKSNNQRTAAYLDMLQFNAETLNEGIRGAAQAEADTIMKIAEANAGTHQANANTWSNIVANTGNNFGNILTTNAKMRQDLDMAMLGATTENQYNYYLTHPYAPGFEAFANRFKNRGGNYEGWYDNLMKARRI